MKAEKAPILSRFMDCGRARENLAGLVDASFNNWGYAGGGLLVKVGLLNAAAGMGFLWNVAALFGLASASSVGLGLTKVWEAYHLYPHLRVRLFAYTGFIHGHDDTCST